MLEHEIKMLEKLENTPSAQSKTEVRQKSVCLKTSRFKLSCFAQTLLRVQIRESFSGETRNQPFKSLGSYGVVAQDFVNAFEKFLGPLFRVSNFDLSIPHVLCVDHQSQSLEAV